jgi:hypothetical protein
MKNLALVFSTFLVHDADEKFNNDRQNDYATCYSQMLRVIPKDFDVLFVDNSLKNVDEITSLRLRQALEGQKILLTQQNFGLRNKGVGELVMLIQAASAINLSEYDTICYCTGRKIFTCPYPFEKAAQTDKQATVSNPDFQFLDGSYREVAKGMYNDMFFAMKSETMIKFINYTAPRLQDMEQHMINSETNLHSFLSNSHTSIQHLDVLGIVRNELKIKDPYNSFENYHVC